MKKLLKLLSITVLISPSYVSAGLLCDQLSADPLFAEPEREYLLSLCGTELAVHSGPIVFMEGGFLPFPEHFYLRVPTGPEIKLASGQLARIGSYEEALRWPYGTVRIVKNDDGQLGREQSVQLIESYGLSWSSRQCALPISLEFIEKTVPGWEFVGQFHRLRIGSTVVLLGGGSENLAIVLAETFARLNCGDK